MCDPVSGIMAGLSGLSTIMGAAASSAAESAQAQAIHDANKYNALQAYKEQADLSAQEGIRQQQERQALANERLNLKKENMQKAATAQATTGAEGNAYNMVFNEYSRMAGEQSSIIDQQLAMQDMGHALSIKGYKDRAGARLGSLQGYRSTSSPALGWLATGLQIGADGLGIYNAYNTRTQKRSDKDPGKIVDKTFKL